MALVDWSRRRRLCPLSSSGRASGYEPEGGRFDSCRGYQMEDAFKIPWIDPRDVKYVKRGMYKVVIYCWRRFHYDVFVEFP